MTGRAVLLLCWPVMIAGTALVAAAGDWLAATVCGVIMVAVLVQQVALRRETRQLETRLRRPAHEVDATG